jgi:hypothetical protein
MQTPPFTKYPDFPNGVKKAILCQIPFLQHLKAKWGVNRIMANYMGKMAL